MWVLAWRWCAGWRLLVRHREIRGYRERPFAQRLLLDHRAAWLGVRTSGFCRAAFLLAVMAALWRIAIWQFDLEDWQRDTLGAVLAALVGPLMASARRRHLRKLLSRSSE